MAAVDSYDTRDPDKLIYPDRKWEVVFLGGSPVFRKDSYLDFDAMINFEFQERVGELVAGKAGGLEALFAEYAGMQHGKPAQMLNYVSSHDTLLFDRTKMIEAGTALLLAPGAAQIFYGDEVARPPGIAPKTDPQQATRSDMPWDGAGVNAPVLEHWRALGAFRRRHVAVAHGAHARLSEAPYVFSRVDEERGDRVVVGIDVPAGGAVTVGTVFAEGQALRDGYTGTPAVVHGGKVVVEKASRAVLLERVGGR